DDGVVASVYVPATAHRQDQASRRGGGTQRLGDLAGVAGVDQIHDPSGRRDAASAASSVPARAAAKSPQRAPSGNTFIGFILASGSNAARTHACAARSSGVNTS